MDDRRSKERMQRKYALVTAGLLTTIVMGAALSLTAWAAPLPATQTAANTAAKPLSVGEVKQLPNQNVTWNQQIEQGKTMFAALDAEAGPQLNSLNQQMATMETDAATRLARIQALQKEIEATQSALQQDAQAYQTQLDQMQSLDAGWRQQVEMAANQLQAAVDQLSQLQPSANGLAGNNGLLSGEREQGEEHEDGEHEGGEHESGEHN
jgi:multidrug resistance efflux pump